MPRGGKRPGAGRKAARPKTARRVMLELSAAEARQLDDLEKRFGISASVVLRSALLQLHEDAEDGLVVLTWG